MEKVAKDPQNWPQKAHLGCCLISVLFNHVKTDAEIVFVQILEQHEREPVILALDVQSGDVHRLNVPLRAGFARFETLLASGKTVVVEEAREQDYIAIEELIREAATEGRGFGLDEFAPTGAFNRNLFRDRRSHAAVVRLSPSDAPIAALVFGTSAVCRTENKLMSGYIAVSKLHRGSGVGTLLLKTLINTAKTLGFEGVLFDVYQTESRTISWSKRHGFHVTGSLPECGYVKNQGFVDALLMYREFQFDYSKL